MYNIIEVYNMEDKKKIFTKKEYLNRPVKCLETGVVYEDIKRMCSVIYGMEYREYNKIGKMIDTFHPIKGNHYQFV